jgi:hypothetical protein
MKHEREAPKSEGNFQALGALQDSRFSTEGTNDGKTGRVLLRLREPLRYLPNTQVSKLEVPIPAVGGRRLAVAGGTYEGGV